MIPLQLGKVFDFFALTFICPKSVLREIQKILSDGRKVKGKFVFA